MALGIINVPAASKNGLASLRNELLGEGGALERVYQKIDSAVERAGGYAAQTSAPDNTNLLWIDTANDNIIKFYDPESETWKPVGAVWWR